MPLADFFDLPAPLVLGGVELQGGPLRLVDLATLDRWCAAQIGDPLAAYHALPADAMEVDRQAALRLAGELADHWPPPWGSAATDAICWSAAGVEQFAWVVLQRHNPTLTRANVAGIVERMDLADYAALARVAWAAHPIDELRRILDPDEAGDRRRPEGHAWDEAICAVAERYSWDFETIGRLTLPAFVQAVRKGKPVERAIVRRRNGESDLDLVRRLRKVMGRD